MYVRGYLQGSENGRADTIASAARNPKFSVVVLFLSLIFCKQEEKLLFFGSVSGCTCLILITNLQIYIYMYNVVSTDI